MSFVDDFLIISFSLTLWVQSSSIYLLYFIFILFLYAFDSLESFLVISLLLPFRPLSFSIASVSVWRARLPSRQAPSTVAAGKCHSREKEWEWDPGKSMRNLCAWEKEWVKTIFFECTQFLFYLLALHFPALHAFPFEGEDPPSPIRFTFSAHICIDPLYKFDRRQPVYV